MQEYESSSPTESHDWHGTPGSLSPLPASNLHRIWNPEIERIERSRLRDLQLEKLRETVRRAALHVPVYREKMETAGLRAESLQTLEDVRQLPFTTKDDFMRAYPLGMLAVPLKDIVRIHGSSGTSSGKSTIVGYTRHDMEIWTEMCARLVTAAGVTNNDIAQIAFGYGLFTGGFGLHQGLERAGATVIPLSSGQTDRQIQFLHDFQVTTLICTPSYALYLAEALREKNIRPDAIPLRWGLFGGEPWTEEARKEIESGLGIVATDNYGLSELCGPGVSYECLEREGMHISEDQFLAEVVDPVTGEPVEEGEIGELVLTSLGREAVPLVRYRTRDLTRLTTHPCRCGRTLARMTKVLGRTDDMIIIRGVNVFPSQIESVLLQVEHTAPHYQIVVDRVGVLDTIKLRVEVTEALFEDEMKRLRAVQEELGERMRSALGLKIDIELVEPRSLERFLGKAKRVLDLRKTKGPTG